MDQSVLLTTGQIYEHHTFVQSSDQPLKITMAYTDVPGFPGAIPALVNDLDLEVVGPDGTIYRGNQFDAGESDPDASDSDQINNVEAVHLAEPIPGDYLVRVRARNVVQDSRLDTQAIDQDFALVISGDFPQARGGIVLLDRSEYTSPGVIKLVVLDAAKAASNTVSVLLMSTTESAGENYLLHPSGNYGAFTGSVVTVVGNAAVDAKLEIHNGDVIQAQYVDAGGSNHIDTAVARLGPPVLSGVIASVDLGVMTITWQTDEPANSIVRYSTNFTFNLSVTNSTLTTNHVVKLTNLIPGATYHFLVSSSDEAGNSATNNNAGAYFSFVAVQTPTVLLVDAYEPDDSSPVIDDGAYTNALAATGLGYSFWKVTERGSPQLADLKPFQAVIWRITDGIYYDGTNNTLSAGQQTMIQNYLNGGGSFMMSSMGILSLLGDVPFRRNVFQVRGFKLNDNPYFPCTECDEQFGVPAIQGADGDPTTTGINVTLDYNNYANIDLGDGTVLGPDFSDTFTPGTNAAPILYEPASGKVCGIRFPKTGVDSRGRVVFLSFPLDTVPANGATPNNEVILLRNILNFLVPGANGVGRIALDSSAYTVPGRVTVEVGDSDLAGLGQTQVTFSTSATNHVNITLSETPHAGLFRGFLTLVGTNAPGTNQLRVKNGDVLTANYLDVSAGSNAIATATIDTVPPIISNVSTLTDFADATISWTTSKPADSLVQFGESTLLGRTAYSGVLKTNHSVMLTGLSANRDYYFQVTSRDDAGNTTVDDNQDHFYTFHTLKAIQPPWIDNLDSGARGWTVVPGSGTDINWTLGVPANALQTNAFSPPNAWGSDLTYTPISQADTYLYSPVLDLSGASKVTLTFQDSYDFTSQDILEIAEFMISTNSATAPVSLVVFNNGTASPDWEEEAIDLTPYAGKTVQLVWHYAAFSLFGNSPASGWMIDDVSVSVPDLNSAGTIVVSKDIAQGSFSLTGPLNQSGQGLVTVISNAPPGQYVVHFGDVAFYQTPPNQTNTLAPSSSLLFLGDYTFADTNHNGISDAWEQYYFGSASASRTQATDSDSDGMSDFAEFIAGTNPTNAASRLSFLSTTIQTNGLVKLEWAAIPGRTYEVLSSTNLTVWSPVTDWLQSSGSPMSYTTTNVSRGQHLYRVQVRP
ncbi:choice-of-anchor J domain-containing protein [Pedosphaera parvula]|uniref:choice-of-anchor J domain-containing protein n=1 Tax=Pedosphaera parvula TaxID=1032527 RepID=UPI0012373C7D|nr:choice-of-anchor J domain-containing protein [Pedosphaera parvula]